MSLVIYRFEYKPMDELVNIANYCNSILVKHGQIVKQCNAIYIPKDDIILVNIKYRLLGYESYSTFQFEIQNYDFLITDTDVQVNRSAINNLNIEIGKFVNQKVLN